MKRNKSRQSLVPAVAETEDETQMVAQFLAFYRDVKRVGKSAPYGQFLNYADKATKEKGQEFLRQTLERINQEEINEEQKKKRRNSVRNAKRRGNTSATTVKPSEPPTDP
jgi:transcription initiation factor TFIID subunit TAF12